MILYYMIRYDMIRYDIRYEMIRYDMIYLTAIGLTPGGSSTVHTYTQTMQRTTQSTQTIHRTTQFTNYRATSLRGKPMICLRTEEKHGKTSVRLARECQLAKSSRHS